MYPFEVSQAMTYIAKYISFLDSAGGSIMAASGDRATWSVAVCVDTRDGAGRKRLYGVSQYARSRGWRMMLVRQSGSRGVQEVQRLKPDGVIAYIADRRLVETTRRLGIPLVDTALGELNIPLMVSLDNDAVGRLAAEHLVSLGLASFGYCGVRGPLASEERRTSFARHLALRNRTLAAFSQRIFEGESQMEPLIRWLQRLPKPVGLLTFDDKLGERVLSACRWCNLSVPHEVAVLGIGNDELMCEVSWPTLSSISFPTQRLGFEAAEMLDLAMRGRTIREGLRRIQPTGVAVRASTDMLAVEDALIRSAVEFIRKHAGEAIGVKHVAAALAVSRRTLDRRFADALGRTVHDELTAARMQLARNLLTDGAQTVADIAAACGYGSAPSFSRAFRSQSGCWPTDYRNQVRLV
jgi:LacI family transcriptional regulator